MKFKRITKKKRMELLEGQVVYIEGIPLTVVNNSKTHDGLIFLETGAEDAKKIKHTTLKQRINRKTSTSKSYYVDTFPFVMDGKKWTYIGRHEDCPLEERVPETEEEKIMDEIQKSIISIQSK